MLALFGLYFSSSSYAADFTLDGPTSGVINVASEPFVITTGGGFNGNIRVTIEGGGLNTTQAFNFNRSDLSQSFTITPTALGTVTIVARSETGNPQSNTHYYIVGSPTPTPVSYTHLTLPTKRIV